MLWSVQLETQFKLANITVDSMKFYCVVSALSKEDLTYVSDIVLNKPEVVLYANFKTRLIAQNTDLESGNSPYLILLKKYGDTTKTCQQKSSIDVKHSTEHHIETHGTPVYYKARRLIPEKLQASKR
ncbi:uncharacterized protein TNCV_3689791 [Trichonephila clavipes]|uniref:DUF7041 domain-containing protein n=1 Tax=Trichonephila clavipes TaxID=2585209 RepID=A0A8X6SRF9_TRICX|nr:uncharacterized protein TNCV_3689791 [Trichonephila clavipes]